MLSTELARQLRDAGLAWHPVEGDRFVLPGHDLGGRVFTISEMVVEVRSAPIGQIIAFNGTTEWALDAIEQAEAVWLPRESQLRESIGTSLLSLVRDPTGSWRCTTRSAAGLVEHVASQAAEAYGLALLHLLSLSSD